MNTIRFWCGVAIAFLAVLGLVFVVEVATGDLSFALGVVGLCVLAFGIWSLARVKRDDL